MENWERRGNIQTKQSKRIQMNCYYWPHQSQNTHSRRAKQYILRVNNNNNSSAITLYYTFIQFHNLLFFILLQKKNKQTPENVIYLWSILNAAISWTANKFPKAFRLHIQLEWEQQKNLHIFTSINYNCLITIAYDHVLMIIRCDLITYDSSAGHIIHVLIRFTLKWIGNELFSVGHLPLDKLVHRSEKL